MSSENFDPASWSGKTSPACSQATADEISAASAVRWQNTVISDSSGLWTLSTSECPSGDAGCSGCSPPLASVLETEADWLSRHPGRTSPEWFAYVRRYSLSDLARAGILRRAEKRGRKLPPLLEAALRAKAPGPT